MHDPRSPELAEWLAELPMRERLTTMHALSFAFAKLKNDRAWNDEIAALTEEVAPSPEQATAIMVDAIKLSASMKRNLA